MMRQIGDELQTATDALSLQGTSPQVLDLCMAPGGYTASALKYNPHAHVSGISLPEKDGGHRVLVRHGLGDSRVEVALLDITMLPSEFGLEDIPQDHPDTVNFLRGKRPYLDKSFDLVFCDGQVLRTHERSPYREHREARRLTCSQLVLAVQRIRRGGTLIILLHKIDAWDTIKLLFQLDKFANIQLFKPKKKHRLRSSFYLIAKDVNPSHPTAVSAVADWKSDWREATFAGAEGKLDAEMIRLQDTDEQSRVLGEFGSTLIKLAEPIWAIQLDALRSAPWMPEKNTEIAQQVASHRLVEP